ncbi:hypothetical protein J7T55_01135 [Diaporthe amygdali]|uniref:uncharacterized protein n=1 Tax=Phomopsis amygdali TaxID=1214568 RepID=UPI0022FEDF92|nr:uncharacterized protein J7T55_01135 [Diaporthe amygdali]KAJ0122897.1 hypothetical protein J7T55_01135 [Diaporthe amygdali]
MSYYGDAQWPAGGQPGWDHQTPPTRSGASSTIPREETSAFWYQFEEVERSIENLVKSGKMFGIPGGRHPRGSGGPQRPQSVEFDGRPGPPSSNLQNFYASQRHQSSRGSNEAEQMMQAKRRMAAQRERELRNYHQEQQYNRTAVTDIQPGPSNATAPKAADRTLSPSGMSEEARRELISRQRSALYGESPFGQTGGYIDETGTPRQGLPVHHGGPPGIRGPSPLTYEAGAQPPNEPVSAGPQQRERNSSNASPASNPSGNKGSLEQQISRTSNSSPGGENGRAVTGKPVAPIGTRPSGPPTSQGPPNPALQRQSTTPLPSPLNQGYNVSGGGESGGMNAASGSSNPTSAGAEAPVGLGSWPQRGQPWGPKTQTSVWG